jgi:hypothetical protein
MRETGGPGRGRKRAAAAQRPVLPSADPGQDVADQWGERKAIVEAEDWEGPELLIRYGCRP